MRALFFVLAFAAAFDPRFARDAEGQSLPCAPRQIIIANLAKDYQEHPIATAIDGNGWLREIFASPKGTYTVTRRPPSPAQIVCLVRTGIGWVPREEMEL